MWSKQPLAPPAGGVKLSWKSNNNNDNKHTIVLCWFLSGLPPFTSRLTSLPLLSLVTVLSTVAMQLFSHSACFSYKMKAHAKPSQVTPSHISFEFSMKIHFGFILLIHNGRPNGIPAQLDISRRWCQGLFRPQQVQFTLLKL